MTLILAAVLAMAVSLAICALFHVIVTSMEDDEIEERNEQ